MMKYLFIIVFRLIVSMQQQALNKPMINKDLPQLSHYYQAVEIIIRNHHYSKVVLQVPKDMLPMAFNLSSLLTKQNPHTKIFVLYDSLKQSCCIDTLGAEHVAYDCLVHFGKACFSSQHVHNHYYIFPPPKQHYKVLIQAALLNDKNITLMKQEGVRYILADQKYYNWLKSQLFNDFILKGTGIELLRLPMDAQPQDQYFLFGYHGKIDQQSKNNILILSDDEEGESISLIQQVSFSLKSLKNKVGQQLWGLNFGSGEIQTLNPNNNKLLMQRYSLITQLQQYKIFGIIVSNTATSFHKQTLVRCQQILKKHHKKCFTFMMNNLNEVKLGNFPEIEVYVIISCYNHSLFGLKDFHRLVVTPNDLQTAFEARPFDEYAFDCASLSQQTTTEQVPVQKKLYNQENMQLANTGPSELSLRQKIQSLDFYREREFKGLQFLEKKEVKKMTKGKVGLAQEYRNIE